MERDEERRIFNLAEAASIRESAPGDFRSFLYVARRRYRSACARAREKGRNIRSSDDKLTFNFPLILMLESFAPLTPPDSLSYLLVASFFARGVSSSLACNKLNVPVFMQSLVKSERGSGSRSVD